MLNTYRLVIFILFILGITFYYLLSQQQEVLNESLPDQTVVVDDLLTEDCIPTFADGGGPYYQANSPFREKIVPENVVADTLIVQGKVLHNDCLTPVDIAIVDVWQANEMGEYQDDWYRGQIEVNEEGEYRFESIVPLGYGSGTGYRPPHIHFKIHIEGTEVITSQMFFPEARGREGFLDAYIMNIEEQMINDEVVYFGYHDIVLPLSPAGL
jgi:protocatechuate 3,4-dioxygenase beta subunit